MLTYPGGQDRAAWRIAVLVVALAFAAASGVAQDATAPEPSPDLSPAVLEAARDAIQARIQQLEAAQPDPAAPDKELAALRDQLQLHTDALANLKAASDYSARTAEFLAMRAGAPDALAAFQAEPAVPPAPAQLAVPAEATLAQLEQLEAEAQAHHAGAEGVLASLEAELQRRAERRAFIPARTAEAKRELDEVKQALAAGQAAEGTDPPALARRRALATRQWVLECELKALAEEVAAYDATRQLVLARRDRALQEEARAEEVVAGWQAVVAEHRLTEAVRQAEAARLAAARVLPAVAALAEANARLAEQRTGPQGPALGIDRLLGLPEAAEARAQKLADELKRVRERVKAAGGFTRGIGILLLRQRDDLPDVAALRQEIRKHQAEMSRVELAIIDLDDQPLFDPERSVASALESLGPSASEAEKEEVEKQARDLLRTRREYLGALRADYDAYFRRLDELLRNERRLLVNTGEYADYIDEHILWVQSAPVINVEAFARAAEAARWLLDPTKWAAVARAPLSDARASATSIALGVLVVFVLLLSARPLRRRLFAAAEGAHPPHADRFGPTLGALGLSVLLAARWPAVLYFLSWRLSSGVGLPPFVYTIASGLGVTATVLFVVELVRVVCHKRGLAEVHFRMAAQARHALSKHLFWLRAAGVPCVFVLAVMQSQSNDVWHQSLGRMAFLLAMVALSGFAAATFRPAGPIMRGTLARYRGGWLDRMRHVWYPVAVAGPFGLAVLAALGYYYSAQQLEKRLEASILLLLGAVLANALVVRWLVVVRRRMAVRRAQEARGAAAAGGGPEGSAAGGAMTDTGIGGDDTSARALGHQTQRLLRAGLALALLLGLYAIWVDVLPALGVFRQTVLWRTTVDGETVPITLASMAAAALAAVVTFVAARNVPALLEVALLQRLPLDRGVRFAIASLTRYVIAVVGVIVTFGAIGIGWGKVQWLIAAMTVGLGFGLQEIFANFVSGLILLFERPIRVGDTVTVGDTTGTVTRIRIRATTILDWDRRELVVPNKEFITGRLVNWTLSDTILRVVFPVGIAYGSNTRLAEQVLLQVARAEPFVLDDPAPVVLFKRFGNSALEFELRVFIPDMDSYVTAWHRLNLAIDDAFREAGIEIAFPQQDLHIRSVRAPFPIDTSREAAPGLDEAAPG